MKGGDKMWAMVAIWITISLAGMVIAGTAIAGQDFAIPAILMLGIGGTIILRGPVGRALARRIEGQASEPVDLEPVLHELDEIRTRMAELEERQDFTERLLAREREQVPERLPPG